MSMGKVAVVCVGMLATVAAAAQRPGGKVGYGGRGADASWRKGAGERIEKYRKAGIGVRVVDANGAAVRGASVRVEQKRHAFGFGGVFTARLCVGGR